MTLEEYEAVELEKLHQMTLEEYQDLKQEQTRVLDRCQEMATEAGFNETQVQFIVSLYQAILIQFETAEFLR